MPRKPSATTATVHSLGETLLAMRAPRSCRTRMAEKSDAQLFIKRAKEPIDNCLRAIKRRMAQIKKQRP